MLRTVASCWNRDVKRRKQRTVKRPAVRAMNQFWFATIEGTLRACKPVIRGGSFASGKSAKEQAARVRACNFETG